MFASLYPKAIMEGYCFSQTQTYQHTFTGFILLTILRSSKEIKFSGVSCGLACYVGLGGDFSLWTTPLPLFPSCYIIDIFSTLWHLHLLKRLCYFYFLKRDSQGGMFRFSLSFLFVSLGFKLFSFYFLLSVVEVVKTKTGRSWKHAEISYHLSSVEKSLKGKQNSPADSMQMWKGLQGILRFGEDSTPSGFWPGLKCFTSAFKERILGCELLWKPV